MFRFFPDEVVLKFFKKSSCEDQARLAQVNKQFNKISENDTLKLNKYKSESTVHSVGHTHVILQKGFRLFFPYSPPYPDSLHTLHTLIGNQKAFNHEMPLTTGGYLALMAAMMEGTLSLIEELKSRGETANRTALLLQEALEEENQSAFKNRK